MQRRTLLALPLFGAAATAAAQSSKAAPGIVHTRVETPLGAFVIAVNPAQAPVTVANYLAYVDAKSLDGGAVYRIVNDANQPPATKHRIAVVQWGMNLDDGHAPPLPPIGHETTAGSGLRHLDGTVSMARLGPGTAASEFFICVGAQPALDFGGGRNPDGQGFAAFGQVVAGRAVVQALHRLGRSDDQYLRPPVAVLSVRRIAADAFTPDGTPR